MYTLIMGAKLHCAYALLATKLFTQNIMSNVNSVMEAVNKKLKYIAGVNLVL